MDATLLQKITMLHSGTVPEKGPRRRTPLALELLDDAAKIAIDHRLSLSAKAKPLLANSVCARSRRGSSDLRR